MSDSPALDALIAVCREGEAHYRSRRDATSDAALRDAWLRLAEARATLAQCLGDDSIMRSATATVAADDDAALPPLSTHEEVERIEARLLRAFLAAMQQQRDCSALRGVLKTYLPQMSACRRALSARNGSGSTAQ